MVLHAIDSMEQLVSKALEKGCNISRLVVDYEVENSQQPAAELLEKMHYNWQVMKDSVEKGLQHQGTTMGGLVSCAATTVKGAIVSELIPNDRLTITAMRALAVAEINASMGLIVAAPTGGSCGIIPAVLITAQEQEHYSDEEMIMALFTVAGIGMVIGKKACLSGAEGGCQAECGSAASMAAGALTELAGGSPQQVSQAAALSLKNTLGLTCDPVGGLVEVPCIKRNAFLAVNALVASDLALAGIESLIPMDEVIDAMNETGRLMHSSLRETAQGGLAVTPTGKIIKDRLEEA